MLIAAALDDHMADMGDTGYMVGGTGSPARSGQNGLRHAGQTVRKRTDGTSDLVFSSLGEYRRATDMQQANGIMTLDEVIHASGLMEQVRCWWTSLNSCHRRLQLLKRP
jgi:hypothetical protein